MKALPQQLEAKDAIISSLKEAEARYQQQLEELTYKLENEIAQHREENARLIGFHIILFVTSILFIASYSKGIAIYV
jgi:hypothetical protein